MPYSTILTLLGAIKYPWATLGFSSLYLIGSFMVSREYLHKGANTGRKCLGRALSKYALYALTGVAMISAVVLVREHRSLEKLCDLWKQFVKK